MDLIFYGGARYEILEKIASNLPDMTANQIARLEQNNTAIINHSKNEFVEIKNEFDLLYEEMSSSFKINPKYQWIEDLIKHRENAQADLSSPLYKA